MEVYVSIDQQRLKSALENMTNPSMPTVKELAVGGIQLLHHARQRDLVWCQQQMEMRIHLAVRETIHAESSERIGERGKERLTILDIEEDLLLGISTRHHVIQRTGYVNTKRSGHVQAASQALRQRRLDL